MRRYTVWIIATQRPDGTWQLAERRQGPGAHVQALRDVTRRIYGYTVEHLVFSEQQWREALASGEAR